MADEPTAMRYAMRGKAHRQMTTSEAHERGFEIPLSGWDVAGCGRWMRDITERAPLSQTRPEDRCRTCWKEQS